MTSNSAFEADRDASWPPRARNGSRARRCAEASCQPAQVMITHDLNILEVALESVAPGEFVVLKPAGSDFKVAGKVRIDVQ